MVGALLCEPTDSACAAGVIFFNNVGVLNMCGHGTIGLLVTLAHLGRIGEGTHKIETPVGLVSATLHNPNEVTVRNVPSYRFARIVSRSRSKATRAQSEGDIAWGGNWFFLVNDHPFEIALGNLERLTEFTVKIREGSRSVRRSPARTAARSIISRSLDLRKIADSKNFVLCPGKAYDRSPCGTGTSAKLACLAADGKLKEGQVWRQESIIGSLFEGFVTYEGNWTIPHIKGSAYVNAEATLILARRRPL